MALGNSSLVNIAYIKESTFGVIPTSGTPRKLRVTGESLDYSINKEASEEINSSRTTSSMIPLSASASGGLETEVSYLEYDQLLESTLQSSFANIAVGNTTGVITVSATFAAGTITGTGLPVLAKGQFFRVSGTGKVDIDGKIFRASKVTPSTSTSIALDANTQIPASAIGGPYAATSFSSSRLVNGSTQTSFTIERQSSDIGEYWAYTGMTPSSLDLSISSGARSTLSFNFMGKGLKRKNGATNIVDAQATPAPLPVTDSKTYDIHSGSTGPSCIIWVDGAPLPGSFVQSLNFTYDNTLREQTAICSLDAVGIGSGTISATGTMEVYFSTGTLYDKFANNENVSLTFSTTDTAGNGYVFSIPKANFSKVSTNAGGKDADLMLSLEFTALNDNGNADAALRNLIQIDRVGAAAV